MKRTIAGLFIVLATIIGVPNLGMANTNSTTDFLSSNALGSYAFYRLPANSIYTHSIFLYPGEARISISGDGDTDLDLYIYDGNGNLVGRSECTCDDEAVLLTVYRGGYFTVKVINRGGVYNDYKLLVQ